MIKVIKEGKLNRHQVKCNICESVLEFSKVGEILPDDFIYEGYIRCPICKNKVIAVKLNKNPELNQEFRFTKEEKIR